MSDPSQINNDGMNNNDDDGPEMVTLRSRDGVTFQLTAEAANLSDLVKDAVADGDDSGTCVDVLRVNSTTLADVVRFLTHYEKEAMPEIPTPLNGNSFAENMTQEWYKDFINEKDREHVFDLLTAANYMQIKPLLDLTCLKVTFELTGKSAEEIREILNLPALTPEEEAKARQEHKWIFDGN
jgi:S-phase kinase-associated protein 1